MIKDDSVMRRFLEINWQILEIIAKVEYGEIHQVQVKEGKLLVNRKKIILEGIQT